MNSSCKKMVWHLLLSWMCQMLGTLISLYEMIKSEHDSGNKTHGYNPNQDGIIPAVSLLDDVLKLRNICYMLKYTGALALLTAFCVLTRQFAKPKFHSVKDILGPAAIFFPLQLLGVVALSVRLVTLFLYTIRHVCDTEEKRSLEPNYIMLGVAISFGMISMFFYIGHVFAFTYNKCLQYEKDNAKQRANITYTNMYEIAVHTNVNTQCVSPCSGYEI